MQRIVKIILLIFCFSLLIISMGCNSPSGITEDDEPTILFVMSEFVSDKEGKAIIYVDNKGNIYYDYIHEPLLTMLEEDRYVFGEIVGHVPSEEAIRYYNKFCNISEDARLEHVDTSGAAMIGTRQNFYGLTYGETEIETVRLWCYGSVVNILNDEDAKEVILWIDSWEWELDKEYWDEETQQWYPNPKSSKLDSAHWYFEE